jgi:iron complex outermembrane receptor protein
MTFDTTAINSTDGRYRLRRALIAWTTLATPLCAAVTPSLAEETRLEEVTVTATRRTTSTLDIPYNISALSEQTLRDQGIEDFSKLMRSVAGLASYDRGPRGNGSNTRIIIRGLNVDGSGTSELRQVTVSPVSVYVDETPLFVNLHLSDINRVEVLRGPQGTLYGSGSLGGTVRFIHNKPQIGEWSGNVSSTVGNTDNSDDVGYKLAGTLNIPAGETAAFRLNAGQIVSGGFVDLERFVLTDTGLGLDDGAGGVTTAVSEDINESSTTFARLSARFMPTDSLTIDASYHYQKDDADGRQAQGKTLPTFTMFSPIPEPFEREVDLLSLEIDLGLAIGTLTSSSSIVDHDGIATANFTPFTFPLYEEFGLVFEPTQYSEAIFRNSDEMFVQELRLVSNGEGKVDWTIGAYYMDHETAEEEVEYLVGLTEFYGDLGFLTDQIVDFGRSADIKDRALFGEVTFGLTDKLRLTTGLRWFDIEVDAEQHFTDPSTESDFSGVPTSYSDSDTIFKVNLAYDLSQQALGYATWSQGYRRGGANSLPTNEPVDLQTFRPDEVQNFEVGVKGTVGDRYRYSASAYYIDWTDVQIATFSPVNFLDVAINGGDASSTGLELELQGNLADNTDFSLAYAYTDSKLEEDFSVADGNFVANKGNRLPGVPEHMFVGAVDIHQPLGKWTVNYHLDTSFTSETVNEVSKTPLVGEYREFDDIWTVAARISLIGDAWTVGIFGENLTNEKGVMAQSALVAIPNQAFEWVLRPRTLGAFVRYEF